MVRYKLVERSPKLVPVVLDAQSSLVVLNTHWTTW